MERQVQKLEGSNDHTQIVKGKRTKRQRPLSPCGVPLTSSSSSGASSDDGGSGGGLRGRAGDYGSNSSATTSNDIVCESTEEEEDMANCLILLAQGDVPRQPIEQSNPMERFQYGRKFSETANNAAGKAGFYVYECKTCNRSFPSFQALGGHRASHKKSKVMADQEKKTPTTPTTEILEEARINRNSTSPSKPLHVASKAGFHVSKAKVHECSICGLEFLSGQALGGHMRRHRSSTTTQVVMSIDATAMDSDHIEIKPARKFLSLDLNLPAPEDDSKFQLTSHAALQSLVFSAPALVDCHY
ncbi:Zinc finger protein ZAT5 [Morella rubra]|uniref:Zinc finger protein ZAT5 n=1 Tax=Morella rubra TaxID=262757 RepID=A0A6A1WML1_9ROSI|nr:Zinc finger protein ZAT5 [Morella rubra]KAB1226811.1 Zinc finger protein ZAT5 [Morella rubra]